MKKQYVILIGFLICFCSSTAFSQDIYVKVIQDRTNAVLTQGASPDAPTTALRDYTRITSMSFGMENPVTIGGGGGGSAPARTRLNDLTITKIVDLSSTRLMQVLAVGEPLELVEILYVRSNDRGTSTIYKVELGNAFFTKNTVSSIPDCTNGCPNVAESFTIIYGKIRVTTYTQNQNGSITTNPNPFVWDQTRNTPTF